MSIRKKNNRRNRLRKSVRGRIRGTSERPRLCVYRSNQHIYAQVVDDTEGKTLAAASSIEKAVSGSRAEQSKAVGELVAKRAKDAGVETVVFDRNIYRYHGRVKALAEGAREAGIQF